MPLADVVASNRPDGGNESVVRAVVCAAIMETGCFASGGGGLWGCVEDGGSLGAGGKHGGR